MLGKASGGVDPLAWIWTVGFVQALGEYQYNVQVAGVSELQYTFELAETPAAY